MAVPSLTLGTIGVHQLDLAAAYGALANGGVLAETYLIEKITDRNGNVIYDHAQDAPSRSASCREQAAYLVTDILADNTDPAQNSIWGQRFQLLTDEGRRPATLKTGTTNDFRDLQAFGYLAPDADPTVREGALVTGVWVGNSDFSAIADVFAADGPTFIWHDYMAEVTARCRPAAARLPAAGRHRRRRRSMPSAGMLPGPFTRQHGDRDVRRRQTSPSRQDTLHQRCWIEAETGKIWQEGCGDQRETDTAAGGSSWTWTATSATTPPGSGPTERWIERWRGREARAGPRAGAAA